jgi:Uncharacterized protein conserved in bacteria (DUF2252)
MRDIVASTASYEAWLAKQIPLIQEDVEIKHAKMAMDPFQFMRATFYRWCELWPVLNPDLAGAKEVLGVGDLHVQNFGTWRDAEGRLVWGVNDFDEAAPCSFMVDLVRTAASAQLAAEQDTLILLSLKEILDSLWTGYQSGLEMGGRPFVLDRRHPWLLALAQNALKQPKEFWVRWMSLKTEPVPDHGTVPEEVQEYLVGDLPTRDDVAFRWKRRGADPKGLGSLGHKRFFALIDWKGGPLIREAKQSSLSAWFWARNADSGQNQVLEIINKSIRSHDPYVRMEKSWLIRPIADCGRIDLDEVDPDHPMAVRKTEQMKLLRAMGFETANVHLGSVPAKELVSAAKKFSVDDLRRGTKQMLAAIKADFDVWRNAYKASTKAQKKTTGAAKKPSTGKKKKS